MPKYRPIDEALKSRRAERHFQDKPLPDGAIDELIALSLTTPSGFNLQPWHITIVTDAAVKAELLGACFNQAQVTEAPATLVISGDREAWLRGEALFDDLAQRDVVPAEVAGAMKDWIQMFFGSADEETKARWVIRQCSLLSMTLMVVAESMGINSCPMEGFVPEKVRAALNLPDSHEVVLVLPIGYGTGEKQDFGRIDISQVTSRNRYKS